MSERDERTGHVFISYVREDSPAVDRLQQALEAAGIRVWRDTDNLWPGEDWRARIRGAITDNALVFIACFSRASAARQTSYQNEELVLAVEEMRRRSPEIPWLIPVRLDDCDIPDLYIGGGRTLGSIQRADLFGADPGKGVDRLIVAVRRALHRYAVTEPAERMVPGSSVSGPTDNLAPGSRHALVIATSSYADEQFRRLRSPVYGASDLAAALSAAEIGGFALTSLPNASAQETRVAIQEFLADRAADDMVLLYLSCHAILDQRGGLYFAASDTKRRLLQATAVHSQWLLDRLDECAATSQVLILDCCFSSVTAPRADPGDRPDLATLFERRGRGRGVLTASGSYEYWFEGDSLSPADPALSVYTAGLVAGLVSGAADADQDGYISVLDAHDYACSYVRRAGALQAPQSWLYGSEGQVWLARSPRSPDARRGAASARHREPADEEPRPQQVALFELRPADLGPNCTIPHALDDQWVSRELIRDMAVGRKSLHELDETRHALVRREYLRALLTARKIVINRSYLLKNPVITRDYKTDPVSRAAFVELLRVGAIVPFLLKERTPIESEFAADPDAAEGARIWNELLSEHDPGGRGRVEVQCVRLSWDDAKNERLVQDQLIDAFAAGIKRAASFDYRRMLDDIGADPSDAFEERLRLLPRMSASSPGGTLTRSALYQRYVIEDQKDVSSGRYDFAKPDMVAFKWLFDLIYNSNLAAALGLALVAPADSAHRSVVYRPDGAQQAGAGSGERYDGRYVSTMVMETVQHAIFVGGDRSGSLAMFDGLTLSDVVEIRNSDVWRRYSRALDALLAEPWLMSHPERGLPFLYGQYAALMAHISGIVPRGAAAGIR